MRLKDLARIPPAAGRKWEGTVDFLAFAFSRLDFFFQWAAITQSVRQANFLLAHLSILFNHLQIFILIIIDNHFSRLFDALVSDAQ